MEILEQIYQGGNVGPGFFHGGTKQNKKTNQQQQQKQRYSSSLLYKVSHRVNSSSGAETHQIAGKSCDPILI